MEEVAGLDLVKRDDHILEENDMLFSEGHCESRDNAGQDVKQLRGPVELEGLVNETVEAVIDGFSNHLSPGDQLSIEPMENILQVLSLSGLFRVKQLEKLLDERRGDVNLKGLDVSAIIDDQLKEELVDRLQMRPSWVRQCLFLLHVHALPGKTLLLENGEGSEDVLLNHVDDQVQMRNDDCGHAVLIIEVVIELLQVGLTVSLFLHLLGVVIIVHWVGACLQLLQELVFELPG